MHEQPFITLEGAKPDSTVLRLTDGSRVAMPGNRIDQIERCIREGRAVTVEQSHPAMTITVQDPAMTITVNPEHIIAAVHTENGGE